MLLASLVLSEVGNEHDASTKEQEAIQNLKGIQK